MGRDAMMPYQMTYPGRQDPGLPRARPGQDEEWPLEMGYCLLLLWIEPSEVWCLRRNGGAVFGHATPA